MMAGVERQQLLVFFRVAVAAALLAGMAECELGDQCEFVYGGLIYPEGRPSSVEHGLHWSKTQSECRMCVERERERECVCVCVLR